MKLLLCSAGGLVLLLPAWTWVQPAQTRRPANDFHFSIVGDRTGGPEPQIYGRVWREVALLQPDFVITVGDAIPGNDDSKLGAEWEEVKRVWRRYAQFPLYHVAGNHDIWSERSREAFPIQTGNATRYSFRYQNALFVVAETGRGEELAESELDFIEKELEAAKECDPKLIFFHKPFWIGKFEAGDTSFRLHRMASRHGVRAVVSGHGHRFLHMARDGVRYMEVGSSGGTMRGKLERGEGFAQGCFYHHVWARVKGSEVSFAVREIDGLFGDGRMFDAADWDASGPKFETSDPAISKRPEN